MTWDEITDGTELPAIQKGPITTTQLVKYAGASTDFNPIHYDKDFAIEAGLDGVIAHGMLTMAFLGQMVTDFAWPDHKVVKISTRFRAITFPGDEITVTGTIAGKREEEGRKLVDIQLKAVNQKDEKTATGKATIAFG